MLTGERISQYPRLTECCSCYVESNTMNTDHNSQVENLLNPGETRVADLRDRMDAFRKMNEVNPKKRFLISRQSVYSESGAPLLGQGDVISEEILKNLTQVLPPQRKIKTFQPDEEVLIISDDSMIEGVQLTESISSLLKRRLGMQYILHFERSSSFVRHIQMLHNTIFPRLIILGYIPHQRMENEMRLLEEARYFDHFFRVVEILDSETKPEPYIDSCCSVHIHDEDELMDMVIQNYNRPYHFDVDL